MDISNKKILTKSITLLASCLISGMVTAGVESTTSYTYNGLGLVETIDGPRVDLSDITTFGYDAQGNRTSITNALGHVTQITAHDASGRPLTIVDPNGVTTQLTYDPRGRLLTRITDGQTTTMDYDGVGNITRITQPNGSYINYEYDASHRLVAISDNLGNRIQYTLDNAGNRTQEQVFDQSNALRRSHSNTFDELSRMIKDIGAAYQTSTFSYDPNGNRTEQIDPNNNTTTQAFDALNRLTQITDAKSGNTNYGYDAQDNLTSVTDPRGNTTSYTYDTLGNVLTQQSPDTGTSTFTYDEAGNRISSTDARDITVNYSYDALNRIISTQYPSDSNQDVTYTYDETDVTNGIGRLTRVVDATGTTRYHYDKRGNTIKVVTSLGGHAKTTQYAYDVADNLIRVIYPSGRVVDYTDTNNDNKIDNVVLDDQGNIEVLVDDIEYLPFGARTSMLFGNGLIQTFNYDLDYRLSSLTIPVTSEANLCAEQSDISESECTDLIELWEATGGDNWTNSTGWNTTDTSPCSWYGITCANGHVTRILLSYNNLTGEIPDFSNLLDLQYLYLNDNQLSGGVPDFSNLSNLKRLFLENNQLSGEIPDFSNLPSLNVLLLNNNQLTGEIPNFSNLPNLSLLYILNNQLTGEIPDFSNLPNLTTLSLMGNQLSGAIPDFTNLLSLQYLYLADNQLTGEIPNFSNLQNLIKLSLYDNQLTGEIPDFSNLSNLTHLFLYRNKLTGEIPDLPDTLTVGAFGYNALTGDLTGEATALDSDWADTQTIPPTDLSVTQVSATEIELSWTPVFNGRAGYYQVYYATAAEGPYTSGPATDSKYYSSLMISGLTPNTTYYFFVKTTTLAHTDHPIDVTSVASETVTGTTTSQVSNIPIPVLQNGTEENADSLKVTACNSNSGVFRSILIDDRSGYGGVNCFNYFGDTAEEDKSSSYNLSQIIGSVIRTSIANILIELPGLKKVYCGIEFSHKEMS